MPWYRAGSDWREFVTWQKQKMFWWCNILLLPLFSFLAESGAKRKVKTYKALLTTKLNINILVLLRENLVIFLCDCLEHFYYFSIFQPFSIHLSFFLLWCFKKDKSQQWTISTTYLQISLCSRCLYAPEHRSFCDLILSGHC